ncbi:MAG: hypothetical protein ACREQA_17110 [Candidatus Binatia bacterium]
MSGAEFCRAMLISGIATFVATVYGYWEVSFGLPKLDFATLLGQRLVPDGSSREFTFSWGMAQHFVDGALLGTLYIRFFHPIYPRPHWFSGLVYGVLIWIASGVVTSPLFKAGFFWWGWGGPALLGVFIWHLVWGLVLGITSYLAEGEVHHRRKP